MYRNGSLVTLIIDKAHGEGDDAIIIKSGICGMVTQGDPKKDGNHQYTIDFGAYGGWYCFHNELSGDDSEGWEPETQSPESLDAMLRLITPAPLRGRQDNEDEEEEDNEDSDERGPRIDPDELDIEEDAGPVVIDLEKDIARRIKELEKGY